MLCNFRMRAEPATDCVKRPMRKANLYPAARVLREERKNPIEYSVRKKELGASRRRTASLSGGLDCIIGRSMTSHLTRCRTCTHFPIGAVVRGFPRKHNYFRVAAATPSAKIPIFSEAISYYISRERRCRRDRSDSAT